MEALIYSTAIKVFPTDMKNSDLFSPISKIVTVFFLACFKTGGVGIAGALLFA